VTVWGPGQQCSDSFLCCQINVSVHIFWGEVPYKVKFSFFNVTFFIYPPFPNHLAILVFKSTRPVFLGIFSKKVPRIGRVKEIEAICALSSVGIEIAEEPQEFGGALTKILQIFLFTIIFFCSSTAFGCPLCHTTTAEEVRAGILVTSQEGTVILAILGPFLALGIILSVLNRADRFGNDSYKERREEE